MDTNVATTPSNDADSAESTCPLCDSQKVETHWHHDSFDYGTGDHAVTLQVELPVRRCPACDMEFLDHEGQQRRSAVIQEYLALPCSHFLSVTIRFCCRISPG